MKRVISLLFFFVAAAVSAVASAVSFPSNENFRNGSASLVWDSGTRRFTCSAIAGQALVAGTWYDIKSGAVVTISYRDASNTQVGTGAVTTDGTPSIAAPGTAVTAVLAIGGIYGPYDSYRVSPSYTYPLTDQPQVVVVTPDAVEVNQGSSVVFTASGGHNGYIWEMPPQLTQTGSTSNSVTVVGSVPGHYSLTVYSPEGAGYDVSNVAVAEFVVGEGEAHFIVVNETNNTKSVLMYRLLYKGQVLDSWELAPGESKRQKYEVEDDTPGQIQWSVKGFSQGGSGVWVSDPSPSWSDQTNVVPVYQAPSVPVPQTPSTVVPPSASVPTPPKLGSGAAWLGLNPSNESSGLTAVQYAEGVDKLLGALEGVAGEGSSFLGEPGEGAALAPSATSAAIGGVVDGLVPDVVVLPTTIGQNGLWEVLVPAPYLGEFNISMDLTRWSGSVAAFRAMLLGCECIGFFFATVSVMRSAFAS